MSEVRERGSYRLEGGGVDGNEDHALTATFRYFVGFHSRTIRCASAICAGGILLATTWRVRDNKKAVKELIWLMKGVHAA